jgi:hypothetical protein
VAEIDRRLDELAGSELAKPTLTASGKRIPGLKLDNPRQLALMHALVRFAQIAAAGTFSTGEIHPHVTAALRSAVQHYGLGSLRYDPRSPLSTA